MLRFKFILLVVLLLPVLVFANANVKTYIPKNAYEHLPTVKKEQQRLLPDFKYPEYFGGLIEHESCISLTHSRCWNSKSQLKTKREQGIGLGQLTRAYKADGSIRFDALSDIRRAHANELKELTWATVYQRPDLQIRAMLLMSKGNYNKLYNVKNEFERLAMTDAAYNGGLGGLLKERKQCGLKKNCDPQYWFGHIEKVCLKSKKALYAGRSACDINRHHVKDVLHTRMPKYKPHLNSNKTIKAKDAKIEFKKNIQPINGKYLNLNRHGNSFFDWLADMFNGNQTVL
jgi:hypothetical protein